MGKVKKTVQHVFMWIGISIAAIAFFTIIAAGAIKLMRKKENVPTITTYLDISDDVGKQKKTLREYYNAYKKALDREKEILDKVRVTEDRRNQLDVEIEQIKKNNPNYKNNKDFQKKMGEYYDAYDEMPLRLIGNVQDQSLDLLLQMIEMVNLATYWHTEELYGEALRDSMTKYANAMNTNNVKLFNNLHLEHETFKEDFLEAIERILQSE